MILYHLRNRHRPHSSSGMTAGRQGLLGMGTAAASAGAAGPSQGLRAGRSSGRTEAGVHRSERTTHLRERADASVRCKDLEQTDLCAVAEARAGYCFVDKVEIRFCFDTSTEWS